MADFIVALEPLGIALAGGVFPALLWLWFWLKEDYKSPEPTGLIALCFAGGMLVICLVFPVEKFVVTVLPSILDTLRAFNTEQLFIFLPPEKIQTILLAGVEETAKYAVAFFIVFQSRHFDEPIDAVIYLITAALGFAAVENTLYLLKDITSHEGVLYAATNTNLRFLGSTVIHTISSAIVGLTVAFSFYYARSWKIITTTIGIISATLLHAYFNLSIMEVNGTADILAVFSRYWIGIVGIIILLELVKRLKPQPVTTP
ncbi:MAG: hypothetical protein UY07_C0022G0021 [Parcubacteria group bacterium GW2011_GWA1_47_8]|nr:MAG: hypothetical protein UW71_C0036G0003 [Parcubacteria group bacterium GW2011_GWB1_44_7]KKU81256.1 MAG: hypothetical protein UY07_C0022G0021 [Parcubacteria group bacterium GW2011_GWA1_47_8]KKW07878.1 MAG: hypothetical protein UY42_C0004G0020 [Parcubacteria group bacterium GW2011_GWA2_49_16]